MTPTHQPPEHQKPPESTPYTIHSTKLGEWQAIWLRYHQSIRILQVSKVSEDLPHLSAITAATAPDLSDMREEHPALAALWNAVRHHYWSQLSVTV